MFEEIKKALGIFAAPAEHDQVAKAFSALEADDRTLPRDIAAFVAKGQPANVLTRIAAVPDVASKVGILWGNTWSVDMPKHAEHRALLKSLGSWEAPALLNLAQVYYAATKSPTAARSISRLNVKIWQGGYEWVELFLRQITQSPSNVWSSKEKPPPPVSLKTVEAIVTLNNQDAVQIARGAILVDTTSWAWNSFSPIFRSFPDFGAMLERRAEVVREAFAHADFKVKVHALESLAIAHADPLIWREEIGALMVVQSKQVRQAAEPLIRAKPDEFRKVLERHACEGDNETRAAAVQAYHRIYGEDARAFLQLRREAEKTKKIISILDDILSIPIAKGADAVSDDKWELPPIAAVQTEVLLDEQFHADLKACLEKAYDDASSAYERVKHQKWAGKFEAVTAAHAFPLALKALEGKQATDDEAKLPSIRAWRDGSARLLDFAKHPSFKLVHLVRWCVLWYGPPKERYWFNHCSRAFAAYAKAHGCPSLRELAAVFDALGLDTSQIGRSCLQQFVYGQAAIFKQPTDGIWPYFAEREQLLEEALGTVVTAPTVDRFSRYLERHVHDNALIVLSGFPRTPKRLVPLMWEIALTGPKADRKMAQAALAHESEMLPRLITSLKSGQMEVRAEAAGWLARLGATEAKGALLAALKIEKKELPQSAMMLALESFGEPVGNLVDREAWGKEAEAQAGKEIPTDLAWFSFDSLPLVRWTDNGQPIPRNLIRLLLLQSFKLKNPEPGPMLRTYSGFMNRKDRAALGRYLLEAWIAQDTIPAHTSDEAAQIAEARTKQSAQWYQKNPQHASTWDEQKHYRSIYNSLLEQCKGSAVASKGILAVAGACADGTIAPIIHRYIKQYYGLRSAQCKALLQALAWVDEANAIQVLLAIGNRFRTKGIQEEAARLCQELADRKNWTLDELADRTMPTAGLDESGELELDFGGRTFTARLGTDMTLTLTNSQEKEISNLPEPNQTDDEEKAKAAKQQLSASRKELKTILKMQADRLYEGMCTQRTWNFEDFQRYVLSHPIVGRFCQRLVWATVVDGKVTGTFRPLPDKTLTNTDDETVTLSEDAKICLAHEVTVSEQNRTAWVAHLSDYKVEPLFQQFGKPAYIVPVPQREAEEINEFRGHVLENFKLRGILTKLGYTRGQAQDGGWFMDYHKRFPGLGIQATINFSGSPLPEENKPVALLSLTFNPLDGEGNFASESSLLQLGTIPAVLVSECWNDIRSAAAGGKGFDSNWEKTVQY